MNNVSNTVQALNKANANPANKGKSNQAQSNPAELQFDQLFSSAMGAIGPAAQLNPIEAQLRESLFKQDTTKPANSSGGEAQAMVFAQKQWAQNQNNTDTSKPLGAAQPPARDAAPGQPRQTTAEPAKPANQASNNTPSNSEKSAQASQEAQASDSNNADTAPADTSATAATEQLATAKADPALAEQAKRVGNALNTPAANQANENSAVAKAQATTVTIPESDAAATQPEALQTAPTDNTAPTPAGRKTGKDALRDFVQSTTATNTKAEPATNSASPNGVPASQLGQANAAAQAAAAAAMGSDARPAQNTTLRAGDKLLATAGLQGQTNLAAGLAAAASSNTGNTPAAATLIRTPVNQPGFAKELGQTISWALGKQLSTVDIRVNPESFGPMNIRLVQNGQQVQLMIRTQDEASANLLSQAVSGLREVLQNNGLQLQQVNIQHGQQQQLAHGNPQAGHQQQGEQGQQNGSRQHNQGGQQNSEQGPADQASRTQAARSNGRLDLFA